MGCSGSSSSKSDGQSISEKCDSLGINYGHTMVKDFFIEKCMSCGLVLNGGEFGYKCEKCTNVVCVTCFGKRRIANDVVAKDKKNKFSKKKVEEEKLRQKEAKAMEPVDLSMHPSHGKSVKLHANTPSSKKVVAS